jgi:hypothetical protein
MDIICAFSSDSRELYKADIYRSLSLPDGHILHFRYKEKYVDENILNSSEDYKNKDVAIFFTHGNLLDNNESNTVEHISIRYSELVHYEKSQETGLFHAYLKLKSFCNLNIDSGNSIEKKPPQKFFSELKLTENKNQDNWHSRVDLLKSHFNDHVFYNIKGIYDNQKLIAPTYDSKFKSSHYSLRHGKKYILKMAFANPDVAKTKLDISDSSGEISINCINPLESSVQYDDFEIPVFIKSLQVMNQFSVFTFKPVNDDNNLGEYVNNIELSLNLSIGRPLLFGLLSSLAFLAVIISQSISNSNWVLSNLNLQVLTSALTSIPWIPLLLSEFLIFGSTSILFFWFNKK